MHLPRLAALLIPVVLALPGTAEANLPAPDGGGSHHVTTLEAWRSDSAYRVQHTAPIHSEPHGPARRTGTARRATWRHIECQMYATTRGRTLLWSKVSGGFVIDAAMKTYTDGMVRGVPRCTEPRPDRVWTAERWTPSSRYRVTEAQATQRRPRLGNGLDVLIERGEWVRITCQTVGRRYAGSRIWDRVARGGYVPDQTVKTYTDGWIAGAPRCATVKPQPPKDVALGDSYSSGLGGDGYFPASSPQALQFKYDYFPTEPPGRAKQCFRNRHAYSRLLAARLRDPRMVAGPAFFLACQGDTTDELLSLQIPQIPANTRLVTLTIGGNDMGFSDVVTRCVTAGRNCADAVREHFGDNGSKLADLGAKLDRVYWSISQKAPLAKVVVIGYPVLFRPASEVAHCGALGADDAKLLNDAAIRLNETIRQAVHRHGSFTFVGLGHRFDHHGPCQDMGPRMWINPITLAGNRKPFSMHPNLRGQREIADAVAAANPGLFR